MEKIESKITSNIVIDELDGIVFGFRGAEYRESINGILPTLVAKFVCETDKFPLKLTEINMTLTVNNKEWRILGNVDEFKFDINIVTLFITLAPRDFYFVSTSNKFLSSDEGIKQLYFNKEINSDITDNTPRELNQVGVTNYKYLNTLLRSMNSPSVFAYTMNSLNITSMKDYKVHLDMDPKIHRYYIEDRLVSYLLDRKGYSDIITQGVASRDGKESGTMMSWDGLHITHNTDVNDLYVNMVDNSKYQKQNRLTLNLMFQYIPDISCGQVIRVDVPNMELTEYLVVERLGVITSEVKFRYKLREI